MKRCRLLELPPELRLDIYEHLYVPRDFKFHLTGYRVWTDRTDRVRNKAATASITLLATCCAIRYEASPVFFNSIRFDCEISYKIQAWVKTSSLVDFGAFKEMQGICIYIDESYRVGALNKATAKIATETLINFLAMIEFSAPALNVLYFVIFAYRLDRRCDEDRDQFHEMMDSLSRVRFCGVIRSAFFSEEYQSGSWVDKVFQRMLTRTGRYVKAVAYETRSTRLTETSTDLRRWLAAITEHEDIRS